MAIPAPLQDLAAAAGYSPATAERILRVQRDAAQVPPGSRWNAPDWEPPHYGAFIMGCVAPQPSDAAETAEAFGRCAYLTSPGAVEGDQGPRLGPGTFGEVLARLIEGAARSLAAGDPVWDVRNGPNPNVAPTYLSFCHNPLRVEVVWIGADYRPERVDVYAPAPGDLFDGADDAPAWRRSAITRSATVPAALIFGAAQMWLDTLRRRGASLPFPPSAPASAGAENEGAGPPAREPASARDRDRVTDPGKSTAPEDRERAAKAQSLSVRGRGQSRRPTGDCDHDRPHSASAFVP